MLPAVTLKKQQVDDGRHSGCTIVTTAGADSCVYERAMTRDEIDRLDRVIWPPNTALRQRCKELWASEGLRYGNAEHPTWGKVGLVQIDNGPCGVLAAIQARTISQLIMAQKNESQASAIEHLVEAIATCLEDAAKTEVASDSPRCSVVLSQASADHSSCRLTEAAGQGLRSVLAAQVDRFDLIALLQSLVATRGTGRIAAELHRAGESSLVAGDSSAELAGQVGFCTECLLMLCVTGCAENTLDPCPPPRSPPQIGIMAEPGLPDFVVGPWLKAPDRPVWVLRWGAHYSCVWRDSSRLWHYNGAADARIFSSVAVEEGVAEIEARHSSATGAMPSKAQFATLQERAEALHSAALLTEAELFEIEDNIADFIADGAATTSGPVTHNSNRAYRHHLLQPVAMLQYVCAIGRSSIVLPGCVVPLASGSCSSICVRSLTVRSLCTL